MVAVTFAPKYWIGRVEDLSIASGRDRLEGLLIQIAAGIQGRADAEVTDLRNMLEEVEKLLPKASKAQRRSFLALYVLFNGLLTQELRMPGHERVLGIYGYELECPSVEAMIVHLLRGNNAGLALGEASDPARRVSPKPGAGLRPCGYLHYSGQACPWPLRNVTGLVEKR